MTKISSEPGDTPENPIDTPGLPVVIQTQYIKDMSFENPNAPETLKNINVKPQMDINIDMGAKRLESDEHKDFYEVTLTLSASATREDKTLFIAEVTYAAAIILQNLPESQHHPMLLGEMPRYLFPYARQLVADLTQNGGYQPIWVNPVNFKAMYLSRFGKKDEANESDEAEEKVKRG